MRKKLFVVLLVISGIVLLAMLLYPLSSTGTFKQGQYCGTCGVVSLQEDSYFCFIPYSQKIEIQNTPISQFLETNYPQLYQNHKHEWRMIHGRGLGMKCALGRYYHQWMTIHDHQEFVTFLKDMAEIDSSAVPYFVQFMLTVPLRKEDYQRFSDWDLSVYKRINFALNRTLTNHYSISGTNYYSFQVPYLLAPLGKIIGIEKIVSILKDDDPVIKRQTASVLREIKEVDVVLIQILQDKNSSLRKESAFALGAIKSKSAVPSLIEALKDDDFYLREEAARALGNIGDKSAIEALKNSWIKHKSEALKRLQESLPQEKQW